MTHTRLQAPALGHAQDGSLPGSLVLGPRRKGRGQPPNSSSDSIIKGFICLGGWDEK